METITGGGMNVRTGGMPDGVIRLAAEGRLSKLDLAVLLPTDKRRAFFDACEAVEKRYTEGCAATQDPCLESGCAVDGEVCLQPLLRAENEYNKACGAVWIELIG